MRSRRGVAVSMLALMVAAGGVALAARAFLSAEAPPAGGHIPSPASPRQSPEPTGHTAFVPRTYLEDGKVVMPVTFPNGTTAEILYPAEVDLKGMGVQPDLSYLSLENPAPRFPVVFLHGPPDPGFFTGDAPVRTFKREVA